LSRTKKRKAGQESSSIVPKEREIACAKKKGRYKGGKEKTSRPEEVRKGVGGGGLEEWK